MIRKTIMTCGILCVIGLQAQTDNRTEAVQAAPAMVDPYQGGWSAKAQKQNADLWRVIADEQPTNNVALLNQYRSERNASLARNSGEIPVAEQKSLEVLADRIGTVAPNTFEAHMAQFYSQFPAPNAFMELDLAMARERDRAELIGPQLMNAVRRDNGPDMTKWSKALKERGDVAPALWKLTDDMLLSTEKGAILFAAGEMDAYPLWSKQVAEGARKDVLVVDERLLGDAAYRHRIWASANASGTVAPAGKGFIPALAAATNRAVFVSLAMGPDIARTMPDKLYVTGLVARYSAAPIDNIALLEKNWKAMNKALDAGPLAKNYLLPGSILLLHYRAVGDEEKASLLEHELRKMAEQLGAVTNMIKTGVFLH